MSTPAARLEDMLNIGPTVAQWLRDVGVTTPNELRAIGVIAAWRRLRAAFGSHVSIVALYALHGALMNVRWHTLSAEMKAELQAAAGYTP